ncbi:hypothetical protein KKD52_10285 [Myxococcota bacterium]|nr:hypothetical protein [Myxococcota bacterium]MBU1413818.1 hypothetical protein [Myxococcota bacterium]MBU1510737.1 hypothetical protein [Myxococcota bacterium]PKN24530.1 MAG: hypothetical protein CVU65_11530 [Deltaproteobacteria bacterium HGW-Deltaproteobacteria-22]
MKKLTTFLFTLVAALSLIAPTAMAQKGRKAPPKPAAVKVDTEASIKALLGEYTMGMTKAEVTLKLKAEIQKYYDGLMAKERTAAGKDEVRGRLKTALSKVTKNTMDFTGKESSWNTSIIDDQYAHRNNESMIASLGEDQQKFFFFYNDKLYKVFIALPAEQYTGFTFLKFQTTVEQIYGKALEEFEEGITGESELHHLLWKSTSGNLHLWAMDKTGVYGNFILMVIDNPTHEQVLTSRKERGVKVAGFVDLGINPIVKTVTDKPEPPKTPDMAPPKDSMTPPKRR